VLLLPMALSTYKPKGMTRYGSAVSTTDVQPPSLDRLRPRSSHSEASTRFRSR
jgi:hypothetical protein